MNTNETCDMTVTTTMIAVEQAAVNWVFGILTILALLITMSSTNQYKYHRALWWADLISIFVTMLVTWGVCAIISHFLIPYITHRAVFVLVTILVQGGFTAWYWVAAANATKNCKTNDDLLEYSKSGLLNINKTAHEYFYGRSKYKKSVRNFERNYIKHTK